MYLVYLNQEKAVCKQHQYWRIMMQSCLDKDKELHDFVLTISTHASPLLSLTILSRRTRRPDFHRQQQSWSEVGTVAIHRCATYSLDTRRPRVLRRSASSLEQPSTAHKTYLLRGRLLKELEIFSVFMSILTVVFLSVFFVLCFYCFVQRPCYVMSHLRCLNLDLFDRSID